MADRLIIYLKDPTGDSCDWLFVDHQFKPASTIETGALSELADKNRNAINSAQQIIVLIPADECHYSQVTIPTKNRQRALQAIPYSLEDQLADDIDDMHFAIGPYAHGAYPVVATPKAFIENILQTLSSVQITPAVLGIHLLAFENQPDRLTVLIEDNSASIMNGTQEIVKADIDNLQIILQMLVEQRSDNPVTNIQVWHQHDHVPELNSPAEDIQLELNGFKKSPLSEITAHLQQSIDLNLLQGAFKPVSTSKAWWQPWRAAAVLLVSLIAIKLIGGIFELNSLEQQNRRLTAEIDTIFKRSFPGSKKVVNARVQMENKLNQLRKGSGSSEQSLIDLLAAATPVFSAASNIQFEAINFRNNKLEIDLLTDNIASLDELKTKLTKIRTLKAEMLSATSADKQVKGRIRLEASKS